MKQGKPMRKYTKTGLLIITLAFPVLIFIFLKVFTSNRFDLPYFVPLRDAADNAVIQPGGDTTFYQIPDLSLTALGGSIDPSASLKGKTIVVSTFSSPCGDTCQKALSQLVRAHALHREYPSVVILTLVNEHDSQIIQIVGGQRPADAGWLISAMPDSTLNSTIQSVFRLNEKVPGLQTISPQARLSLVDGAGFIRGFYDTTNPDETDRLMAEIRILEYNREVQK